MSQEIITRPAPQVGEKASEQTQWEAVFARIGELGLKPDSAGRAEQLSAMTGDGIMDMATRLHEVLAPDIEHTPTDYVMNVSPPDGSSKKPLMQPAERAPFMDHAAELVRELADRCQDGEEDAALKRAANVAALSLVLAHPFADGNGRTARTVAHLIREGYDGEAGPQRDLQTIGGNRPPGGFRINSYLPIERGLDMDPAEVIEAAAGLDIPLSQPDAYNSASREIFTKPYDD